MNNIIFIQPEIPNYRTDFFERLSMTYGKRLRVFHSTGTLDGLTTHFDSAWAQNLGILRALPGGLAWQHGVAGLKVRKGDIVVISGNPRQISSLILLAKARLSGARVIWWGHYWSSTNRRWRFALRMILMKSAHAILFYTDQEVVEYRATLGCRDGRPLGALNNGLNIGLIRANRNCYDPETRPPALLFVGRLTKKAQLDLLIKALSLLTETPVSLDVIGSGEELDRMQKLAHSLGVANLIRWHGALTDESYIANIANNCRVFIYPGGVGLSLIHGMAYGLPAVVHSDRWSHMPEIAAFEDGLTGCVFEKNNPYSLAEVIREMHNNLETLRKKSEESVSRVENKYNTEEMARRFVLFAKALK